MASESGHLVVVHYVMLEYVCCIRNSQVIKGGAVGFLLFFFFLVLAFLGAKQDMKLQVKVDFHFSLSLKNGTREIKIKRGLLTLNYVESVKTQHLSC